MTSEPRVQGAVPPRPGVTPDLANPADVLHTVNLVAQIVSVVLVSAFVLLRTYTKAVLAPPFLLDDWACVVAWILAIAYSMTGIMMYHYGGGHHIWEVSADDYVGFLKTLYADTVIYGPTAYFTKVALLLVVARVFHPFTATRVVARVLMAAMAAYYLPALLVKINVCRPITTFWAPPSSPQTPTAGAGGGGRAGPAKATNCINQADLFVADTVLSAVTDFAVLALPVPASLSLRLPLCLRLRVWAMLGLGGIATLASIMRMLVVTRLPGATDQTVQFVHFKLLGTAEISVGLICACLPALNILYTQWQQLRHTSAGDGPGETGGGTAAAAMPTSPMRLRTLKFLHGSRLRTAPPLSAIDTASTATNDANRVEVKSPPPRVALRGHGPMASMGCRPCEPGDGMGWGGRQKTGNL